MSSAQSVAAAGKASGPKQLDSPTQSEFRRSINRTLYSVVSCLLEFYHLTVWSQAAVRALAFKWIRIVYRCWKTRTLYNEAVYLKALERRGSPLIKQRPLTETT